MEYPNWFNATGAQQAFELYLYQYKEVPCRFLQIGAYTGDASIWMLDNILTHPDSRLVDVDTWQGSEEQVHKQFDWKNVEETYLARLNNNPRNNQVWAIKSTSDNFFHTYKDKYDFIYIDGDHTAFQVMKDAINAYECLATGGILAFDDYTWTNDGDKFNEPKIAIDCFLAITQGHFEMLEVDTQVWVRKTK